MSGIVVMFAVAALTRGGFTVEPAECPSCPYRMRFSADGKKASVNMSRVKAEDYEALSDRAFSLMEKAADTGRGGKLRPLMGWSSWNTFGVDISDSLILEIAKTMSTNGLKSAGYTYVNIDDGFFNGHDPDTGILRWNYRRFPNGMKPVVDGIHALGLKAGTYSDAGSDTCGSLWMNDVAGVGAGLYGHDAADCKLHFNDLGFDFIKVDYCGGKALQLDERIRYTEISDAIRATGREVRYNICRWAFPGIWGARVAESWRTTEDIRASWSSVRNIIAENLYLSQFASAGHYNDMDMLQVGRYLGEVKDAICDEDVGLTQVEEATHFGMWCMMSSPLLIGCDVRKLPETTRELVTNPFLLAMNQNDLGQQGHVAWRDGDAYVLVKDADECFGKARFVAFYNAGDALKEFSVDFRRLELDGKVAVLDLCERADLGVVEGVLKASVAPHASRFYRLDAETRLDREVYEAETAYLAAYQELDSAEAAATPYFRQAANASGGVVVANLGASRDNDLLWRGIRVSTAGRYRFEVRYQSDEKRTFYVQVDYGPAVAVTVDNTMSQSKSWSVDLDVRAGSHTVRVFNSAGRAPDIDALLVNRLDSMID